MADLLKKACKKGLPFKFIARGMSMSPFICDGDTIIIQPASQREAALGDIVAFICPENGTLIIHRIVNKTNDKFLLKGDNVFHYDGWVEKKNILGYANNTTCSQKKSPVIRTIVRHFFQVANKQKNNIAILSRYNITTIFCRILNKFYQK
ncbi:MAG: S24/S26 family peptidase [Desulfobacula sp.]|nr:S24/S26 family peptidase [Desulfobacula sp.]